MVAGLTSLVSVQLEVPRCRTFRQMIPGLPSRLRRVMIQALPHDGSVSPLLSASESGPSFGGGFNESNANIRSDRATELVQNLRQLDRSRVFEVLEASIEQLGLTQHGSSDILDRKDPVVAVQILTKSQVEPTLPLRYHSFKAGDVICHHSVAPTSGPQATFSEEYTASTAGLHISKMRPVLIERIDHTANRIIGYKLSTHTGTGLAKVAFEERKNRCYAMIEVGSGSALSEPNSTGRPVLEVKDVPKSRAWKENSDLDLLASTSFLLHSGDTYRKLGSLTKESFEIFLKNRLEDLGKYARLVIEDHHGRNMGISLVNDAELQSSSNASVSTPTSKSAEASEREFNTSSEATSNATSMTATTYQSYDGLKTAISAAETTARVPGMGIASPRAKHWPARPGVDPAMSIFELAYEERKRRGSGALPKPSGRPSKIPRLSSIKSTTTRGYRSGQVSTDVSDTGPGNLPSKGQN